jgi:hypothetical protein
MCLGERRVPLSRHLSRLLALERSVCSMKSKAKRGDNASEVTPFATQTNRLVAQDHSSIVAWNACLSSRRTGNSVAVPCGWRAGGKSRPVAAHSARARGVEPLPAGLEAAVLPLDDAPKTR